MKKLFLFCALLLSITVNAQTDVLKIGNQTDCDMIYYLELNDATTAYNACNATIRTAIISIPAHTTVRMTNLAFDALGYSPSYTWDLTNTVVVKAKVGYDVSTLCSGGLDVGSCTANPGGQNVNYAINPSTCNSCSTGTIYLTGFYGGGLYNVDIHY